MTLTPFEQLRQKPREVRATLTAMVQAHLAYIPPGPGQVTNFLAQVLIDWEDKRSRHPDWTEVQLATNLAQFISESDPEFYRRLQRIYNDPDV